MVAACKTKTEVLDGKVGATNGKAKVATTQDESKSELALFQQVVNLMSMMKSNQIVGEKARNQSNNCQHRGNGLQSSNTERTTNQSSANSGLQTRAAGSFSGWQQPIKCYHCGGWGHYSH